MARVFAFNIFFFLLPFLLYAGYLLATKGSLRNAEAWQLKTIGWLAVGGAVLMVGTLIIFLQVDTAPGDSVYRPARYVDGKIIPGEFVPADQIEEEAPADDG